MSHRPPVPRLDWQALPADALSGAAAADWDRLNAARLDLPFLSAHAVAVALTEFGTGSERLWVARQGGSAVAMFVLTPQGRWRWRTFQPSQLPLGAWVAVAELGVAPLATSLLRGALGICLALDVTQIDPLAAPRADDAEDTEHADYIETGWVDVDRSFADYWAARGKNLRQNLRKQRNKLAAEGIRTQLRMLTRPDEMAPALARYGALESAGWKAGQGTSIAADNAQGRFYTRLFAEAAERGEARVCEYLFDERSVAMNLCLLRGGVLTVLKTTYDESIKLFSPASLLREEEMQQFFASGEVRRIEYYGRLMEWHTRLTDRKRSLYHLTVFRWPFLKRLAVNRRATVARRTAREAAAGAEADAVHGAPSPAPDTTPVPSSAPAPTSTAAAVESRASNADVASIANAAAAGIAGPAAGETSGRRPVLAASSPSARAADATRKTEPALKSVQ